MIGRADLVAALSALSERRPVFHSEADLQHELAWILRERHSDVRPRLERPVDVGNQRGRVDVWLREETSNTVIELKYETRKASFLVSDEGYDLRDGAPDWFRYDLWKDVARTESLIGRREADAGYVIALSNNHLVWNEGGTGAISAAFSAHDGRRVHGSLAWSPTAGLGSTSGRESSIDLRGHYVAHWEHYSRAADGPGGEFRYLLLGVGDGLAAATGRTSP